MPAVPAIGVVTGLSTVSGTSEALILYPGGQSVNESLNGGTPLETALKAGLRILSANQEVDFVSYNKVVLPYDGYVFWVRSKLLSQSSILNDFVVNSAQFNQPRRQIAPAETFRAKGSLHYSSINRQDATESFTINRVIFTSEVPVNDLNQVSPTQMYLATIGQHRFAFTHQENYYQQANLYHYSGDALYPPMESMVIDDVSGFDTRNVIVSNSMPIWLSLNQYMPMYPAYLVDTNISPPYCAVDIPYESTHAMQMAPRTDRNSDHWQLVGEHVTLTMYGLRNFNALDFLDYVLAQSLNYNTFGIMNSPVVRDEKRTQAELNIIAMKKSIELDINYYQVTVRNLARQLILEAIPTIYVAGGVSALVL